MTARNTYRVTIPCQIKLVEGVTKSGDVAYSDAPLMFETRADSLDDLHEKLCFELRMLLYWRKHQ